MPNLLTIDDDRTVLRLVDKAFEENPRINLVTLNNAEEGLRIILEGNVDVCLLDILLPEMNGLELAKKIRAIDARLPIIFVTSLADSDTAIEAMKLGAYDFCNKPLDIQQVQDVVERALEARRLMSEPVRFEAETGLPDDCSTQLIGKSPQMVEVYKQIGRVADQMVPVLIRGESGTGKELIARAIYQHSNRKHQSYLAVNCAALSDTLLESELFGHEKGSFTSAERRHIGKFEQCSDGTIFLDEIGDMSPLLQSKILRLLQEQQFERVGGTETISTNSRIISATNRNLEEMIGDNEFRLDLYHRINAVEISLPPLREREGDIELLTNFFIRRFSRMLNQDLEGISTEAVEMLQNYSWPGNVRELQSTIRRAILMSTGPVIVPEDLLLDSTSPVVIENHKPTDAELESFIQLRTDAGSNDLYAEALEMMERTLLTNILRTTAGNQSQAAEILGITRGSLRHKIRALNIQIEQVIS